MKVISTGSTFRIYPDDLKTFESLPLGTYKVQFSKMEGFFLVTAPDLVVGEDKVYGQHEAKMDKVVRTYKAMNRSMGIILSGPKGIGKSLSLRLLAQKINLPVIMVDSPYPGLPDFLESIQQEVMVVLDEFEKTFPEKSDDVVSQEDLLGLFDGTSSQKRLYALSANKKSEISEYLLNRPGRIHYHFEYSDLSEDEIEGYLKDHVSDITEDTLNLVKRMSAFTRLNFDILRAIAQELNLGYPIKEILEDLNVSFASVGRVRLTIKTTLGDVELTTSHSSLLEPVIQTWGYENKRLEGVSDVNRISVSHQPLNMTMFGGEYVLKFEHVEIMGEDSEGEDITIATDKILSVTAKSVDSRIASITDLV